MRFGLGRPKVEAAAWVLALVVHAAQRDYILGNTLWISLQLWSSYETLVFNRFVDLNAPVWAMLAATLVSLCALCVAGRMRRICSHVTFWCGRGRPFRHKAERSMV